MIAAPRRAAVSVAEQRRVIHRTEPASRTGHDRPRRTSHDGSACGGRGVRRRGCARGLCGEQLGESIDELETVGRGGVDERTQRGVDDGAPRTSIASSTAAPTALATRVALNAVYLLPHVDLEPDSLFVAAADGRFGRLSHRVHRPFDVPQRSRTDLPGDPSTSAGPRAWAVAVRRLGPVGTRSARRSDASPPRRSSRRAAGQLTSTSTWSARFVAPESPPG